MMDEDIFRSEIKIKPAQNSCDKIGCRIRRIMTFMLNAHWIKDAILLSPDQVRLRSVIVFGLCLNALLRSLPAKIGYTDTFKIGFHSNPIFTIRMILHPPKVIVSRWEGAKWTNWFCQQQSRRTKFIFQPVLVQLSWSPAKALLSIDLAAYSIYFRAIRRNVHTNVNPNSKNECHQSWLNGRMNE